MSNGHRNGVACVTCIGSEGRPKQRKKHVFRKRVAKRYYSQKASILIPESGEHMGQICGLGLGSSQWGQDKDCPGRRVESSYDQFDEIVFDSLQVGQIARRRFVLFSCDFQ